MPSDLKRTSLFPVLALLLAAFVPVAVGQATPGPESVVVVANPAMEGSLKVARHYMQQRAIPEENLILLETVTEEKIGRQAFIETLYNPLLAGLLEKKLIDAFEGSTDAYGRDTVTVFSTKVRYVVLCYGIPAHVTGPPPAETDDTDLLRRHLKGRHLGLIGTFMEGNMARTDASVDGELSLLLFRDMPFRGFYPNPLYGNLNPQESRNILRVTRLDGPSPEAVIRMIGNALEGERQGLKGRAYVDEDGRGGGFAIGNEWMAKTASQFEQLGFDLSHDKKRSTFQAADRFDAPVLYAGWYAHHRNGPFVVPGWTFPKGAVAAHLHSFSARPIRSANKGWVGPLIEKGVSATFGNVAEPYLSFTHQFDGFFIALSQGWNFGDAAYLALPGLSWQGVAIGDPLYRPFAVGLDEQLEAIGDPLKILEDQYVVIRKIRQLLAADQTIEALTLADKGMRETPGPAMALLRAELYQKAGKDKAARRALAPVEQLPPTEPGDWGLYADIADKLLELGDAKAALRIYQKLEKQKMPEKVQLAFLKRGIKSARNAGEQGLAIEWQARVTPPPKKETAPPVDKSN
ncbi:MAG: TIGR03790 family protein [Puniceicoccaceae bacterium]